MAEVLFRELAREWWELYMLQGNADYAEESWRRLEREAMPSLGEKHIKKITAPMILKILRGIEVRDTLVARDKVKSHISQILRYGIACGHILSNPARDLGFALKKKRHRPRPAVTEPRQVGLLMRDIEHVKSIKRRCSLKLAAYTLVRPGELCQGEWTEFEMNTAVWRIPGHKMKMKRPHIVPLPWQAIETLRELQAVTGDSRWLFPSRWNRAKHESGKVLSTALHNMGYEMSGAGFRPSGATILSERGWPSEVIERQLAHEDKNKVRAAYQRSELLAERAKMMQWLADHYEKQCARAILKR